MERELTPDPNAYELTLSGLKLEGGTLVRRTTEGKLVAQFEVAEMSGIDFVARRENVAIGFGAVFATVGVATLAFNYSSAWAWVAAFVSLALAGFCYLGGQHHAIVFTVGKSRLEFPVNDPAGDGRAFAHMLQQHQRRSRL